jgi:hypothetical protein
LFGIYPTQRAISLDVLLYVFRLTRSTHFNTARLVRKNKIAQNVSKVHLAWHLPIMIWYVPKYIYFCKEYSVYFSSRLKLNKMWKSMGNLKNFRNHCKFISQHMEFHRYFLKLSYIFHLIIFFPRRGFIKTVRDLELAVNIFVYIFFWRK